MPAPPPAGWDPNAPVIPPWVDPNSGYVIGEDYDKNPIYQWFPNGQYQWNDPYLNADAIRRKQLYPEYWSYQKPDPNWRPSFFGETPPWHINPDDPESANRRPGQWFGHSNDPTPEEKEKMDRYSASVDARNASYESDVDAAFAAGAKKIKFNKNVPGGGSRNQVLWYYPPGYKGPRIKALGSNVEEKSTSDLSVLGGPSDA